MKRSIVPLGVAIAILIGRAATSAEGPPFELRDGDRVVLIGGTMIEREQASGYLETRLTRRYPDRPVAFPQPGLERRHGRGDLPGRVRLDRGRLQAPDRPRPGPQADSDHHRLRGERGVRWPGRLAEVPQRNLDRLLKALEPTKARLVFLSRTARKTSAPPCPTRPATTPTWPSIETRSRPRMLLITKSSISLTVSSTSMKPCPMAPRANPRLPLTDNGIHFNAYGYWRAAAVIEPKVMRSVAGVWRIMVDRKGLVEEKQLSMVGFNMDVTGLTAIPGGVRFEAVEQVPAATRSRPTAVPGSRKKLEPSKPVVSNLADTPSRWTARPSPRPMPMPGRKAS